MTYVKELPAKPLSGREYTISIGELAGTTQFYIAESRIYVLLAMNSPGGVWVREKLFESFSISRNLPRPQTLTGETSITAHKTTKTEIRKKNRVLHSSVVSK